MKQTWRLFGIPVLSIEYEGFDEETVIRNSGGQFELCEYEEPEYEYDEEEYGFGFGAKR